MSGEAPGAAENTSRRRGSKNSVPFWKRDLSSLGGAKSSPADDRDVEHPAFSPVLPGVNLLPPVVAERIRVRQLRRRFTAAGALLIVAAGIMWLLQSNQIQLAQDRLASEQSRNAQLTAQVNSLDSIERLYNEITGQQEVVTSTLADQPQAASVIDRLLEVTAQSGVENVSSVAIAYTGIPEAGGTLNACPNPDPFTDEPAIGCLTFSADAASRSDVSNLLLQLEADPLFIGPYVTDTTSAGADQGNRITFTGTVAVSPDALETPLTVEELEAILAPPAPAPTESAAADAGGTQ